MQRSYARSSCNLPQFRDRLWKLLFHITQLLVMLWYYRPGRVLVLLTGWSLLSGHDLRYARLLGMRSVAVFLGSDSRPPYLSGIDLLPENSVVDCENLMSQTAERARFVRRVESQVDTVICAPGTAHFLTRPFVNWFVVGMAVPDTWEKRVDQRTTRTPVIVHAPTRPAHKGTQAITECLRELEEKGLIFDFVRLEQVSNSAVQKDLLDADIGLDQLYSDNYLGGFGVEAVEAGAAVIVFGNAEGMLRSTTPWLPLIGYFPPDSLQPVLERAITDRQWLEDLAREQHAFVQREWSAKAIAERFVRIAQNDLSADWLLDPQTLDYAWGWGMSQSDAVRGWTRYFRHAGPEGFFLAKTSPTRQRIEEEINRQRDGDC